MMKTPPRTTPYLIYEYLYLIYQISVFSIHIFEEKQTFSGKKDAFFYTLKIQS